MNSPCNNKLEQILETRIAELQAEYLQDESMRERHLASRLYECYNRHYGAVVEQYIKNHGEKSIPVLIGKHFSYVFIQKAAEYGVNIINYTNLFIAHNPQDAGEIFGSSRNLLKD